MENAAVTIELSDGTIKKSQTFIGKWNGLISTTNWEKGKIISQWRAALKDNNAPITEYSDEAWGQLVGGVTPQHVGRLRRTYDRFGGERKDYKGLYWSHFYAALDWEDAEMWLEGAIQNKWSISSMRHQRWETLGKVAEDKPQSVDIVDSELVEENQSLALAEQKSDGNVPEGPLHEGPDFGDKDDYRDGGKADSDGGDFVGNEKSGSESSDDVPFNPKPFEAFTDLPDDVMDAVNAFKVSIISHKAAEWEEIPKSDMLGVLDALKQLVNNPAGE